jgi:nucleotide-binding universal stress UspA family protein
MIAMKTVLVPTDFTDTSMVAVKYGAALARAFQAKLCLLHVVHTGMGDDFISAATLGMLTSAQRSAGERLAELLTTQEKGALRPEYVVRVGAADVEVVAYATEHDVDLIIVATRGRGAIAHILEGSLADRLVRKAPCPVLIVRHPEHEFVLPDEAAS